ncbi:unnamed protein product [Dovyalis caffra]|uniref:Nucleoplasmin-like domain-containing protein n=1 Tax=Dovyalis caffra TaxID=77055 RepID=A0AAV1SKR0_9ROSI|nr:unnamed protein product [Dovyalis caffra]
MRSKATLELRSSLKNSVVQCNVGNSSPVFLCSLFPGKAAISQLDLETEVDFSVIGFWSIHLSGYDLGCCSSEHFHLGDEISTKEAWFAEISVNLLPGPIASQWINVERYAVLSEEKTEVKFACSLAT